MMINKIVCVSLFSFSLSLSACIDEADDHARTAEGESSLSGMYRWKNVATQRCLDSNYNGDIYTLDCNAGNFQLWAHASLSFGDSIRDVETARCVDSNESGKAYTLPCNGGAFQQWVVRDTGNSGYEITDVATGLCLDSDVSGHVYTLQCNGGNYQRWQP